MPSVVDRNVVMRRMTVRLKFCTTSGDGHKASEKCVRNYKFEAAQNMHALCRFCQSTIYTFVYRHDCMYGVCCMTSRYTLKSRCKVPDAVGRKARRQVPLASPVERNSVQKYGWTLYTTTLFNLVVPTCSVWQVTLFRETGVVHRIKYSFNCFYLQFYLLNLLLIKLKKKKDVLCQVKQLNHILLK